MFQQGWRFQQGCKQGSSKVPGRFQQGSSKVPERLQEGSSKVASSKVPARLQARFHQGSSKVPGRFQQGSSKGPARFQQGARTVPVFRGMHFSGTTPWPQRLKPNTIAIAVGNIMLCYIPFFGLSNFALNQDYDCHGHNKQPYQKTHQTFPCCLSHCVFASLTMIYPHWT